MEGKLADSCRGLNANANRLRIAVLDPCLKIEANNVECLGALSAGVGPEQIVAPEYVGDSMRDMGGPYGPFLAPVFWL
jgi:hypothetical protein